MAEGCNAERPEGGRGPWLWATAPAEEGLAPSLSIRGTLAGLSQPRLRSEKGESRRAAVRVVRGAAVSREQAAARMAMAWCSWASAGEAAGTWHTRLWGGQGRSVHCTRCSTANPPTAYHRTTLSGRPRTAAVPGPPGRHLLPTWVSEQLEAKWSS